jgi:hypothetical protein
MEHPFRFEPTFLADSRQQKNGDRIAPVAVRLLRSRPKPGDETYGV